MLSYIIRRVLMAIPILIGISILTFSVMHLAPGSPSSMMMSPDISPEVRVAFEERYGLNDPIPVQYVKWMGAMLQGDMGYSLVKVGMPVNEMIMNRLPNTLILMGASTIIAVLISIPLGIASARRQYSLTDYSVTVAAFVGVATPNFWIGLLLIMFFSVNLGWMPSGGIATLNEPFSIVDRLHHLVMPALVLATADMAGLTRYSRSSMLEVIQQDYMRTAKAKGFKENTVIYKHGLRNGLIPIITIFGLMLPSFFAGSVVVEKVFSWPGIGDLLITSVFQRDYPVVMGITMISAVLVVVGNLLADIAYAIFDPRIEY
ncbi:ABC transporter permease [Salipaludibacillus sp. LMS25]|uniref:ABC transporter permease n=1 Tax=Salipaludibacillus sp. LMS25 TaxID=2924031 RepID=UPI0020D0E9DE|nr:ABC transporter permease [Salipaludibacillus sp. LMS25]UTR13609.1 ABC transporter permease [Salipaludibacillus sp. LMS25]